MRRSSCDRCQSQIFCRKSRFLPKLWGPPLNIATTFWYEKTRTMSLPDRNKNSEDMLTRFHRVRERVGQTDTQTDRQTDTARRHRPRLCIASRSKKKLVCVYDLGTPIDVFVATSYLTRSQLVIAVLSYVGIQTLTAVMTYYVSANSRV